MQNSLLLVDDETSVATSLSRLLKKENYQVFTADSGEKALEILQKNKINVIVSDQRMPNMTGSELFAQVKEKYPDTIRIILSGFTDFDSLSEAINKGAIYKFLEKPWNNEVLRAEIRQAFNTQSLIQHNKKLNHLFENTIEAITICNEHGCIESVNPAFSHLTDLSPEDVIGTPLMNLFDSCPKELSSENLSNLSPADEWHGELTCNKSNGGTLPVWLSFMTIKGVNKAPYFVALFIDISKLKRKEAHIEFQVYHDALTGLANRQLFNDHLDLAFHQSKRDQKELAVLFLDLDRFKIINDTLGHTIGDVLLIEVSKRLTSVIRKGEILARFDGDEFVIILPNLHLHTDCETVAKKIIGVFNEPFKIGSHCIYTSPSIGISTTRTGANSSESLIQYANTAMYQAKAIGGNGFQHYDAIKNNLLCNHLQIENSLHEAIKNDEFLLHYQPQIDPCSGKIENAEALVRWQHPDKGIQPPGSFIHVAENNGLILPIGQRILHQACSQLEKWWQHQATPCQLSVNLSARQFNEPNLLKDICALIDQYHLNPAWLEIEVTESILINDFNDTIKILRSLREIGVGIALDNFGTGYSSLSYLKQLPITTLKIDQSFIKELPMDNKICAITRLLLGLSKELGIRVVAEGVETIEQYNFLKSAGCDLIQGYYISKAVNNSAFKALVQHTNASIPIKGLKTHNYNVTSISD
jgi:diguanylate cyclase (GGDEF)-like protein/PAS domain S-box-containing protein